MIIASELLEELLAHARAEYDAECCGMIACDQRAGAQAKRAVRVRRAANVFAGRKDAAGNDAGRKRFEIHGNDVYAFWKECEDSGLELGAIYHSHTHTEPYPSQTDVNFAAKWPGVEWVIVGLGGEQPDVRSYLIDDGEIQEVELEVR
jgi:proteasome lid subunit RPN8/RPN11